MMRVAILSLLVVSAAFTGCSNNPSTGRNQLLLVDADETAQMGVQGKPELIKEYGGEVKSPELRRYVQQVGRRLSRHVEDEYEGTEWEFTTLDSEVINAFALPGGKVFMSRGLLEQLDSEAALAGVLGHEIGHVTARHVDERISHAMVVQGLAGVGSAALGGSNGWSQVVPLVVGAGGQGYLLKFGRDQESEADRQGLKYMTRAGYDPMGMADVMKVLIAASEGSSRWEILATHPDPQRRLDDIMEQIKTEYPNTQNNAKYKRFENRFEKGAVPYLDREGRERARQATLPSAQLWCAHCRDGAAGVPIASAVMP